MRLTMVLVMGLLFGACNDDDPEAPAKCQVMAQHFCTRVSICSRNAPGVLSNCLAQTAAVVDCSKAVKVGDNYALCIAQLDTLPCEQISALPASCAGAIHVRK